MLRIFTSDMAVGELTTSDTITIDWGGVTVIWRAWSLTEFSEQLTYITGNSTSGLSSSATITSTSITNGNVIFGAYAKELADGVNPDTDTTNGDWSTEQNPNGGGNPSTGELDSQFKIVTASGAQTYNVSVVTGLNRDYAIGWIELQP